MHTDAVFSALADPTRREILEALARHGSCTATELAAGMPITRQAVAKHLGQLHDAALVIRERRGRETHYRPTTAPLRLAVSWLEDVCGRAGRIRAA